MAKRKTQYDKLAEEYKRLAWKLDKQMYRIEKASHKDMYKGITKYAYVFDQFSVCIILISGIKRLFCDAVYTAFIEEHF